MSTPTIRKITASDPLAASTDVVAENIAKLKTLFPELITEGEKGASINVDVLKQLVGDQTLTDADEKFGLNWHGKRQARQLALTPSTGTLRPCPEESVDWESTRNVFIEGDNLESLKLLQKSFAGQAKVIYIDPPYNTGGDFVYPDDFKDNLTNYRMLTGQLSSDGRRLTTNTDASGRFHTDWLNMMFPRLRVARTLLNDLGVVFISIDDNEVANLQKVCDDVFGSENFVGVVVWQTATDNNPRQISTDHEYVLCYAKNKAIQPEWAMPSDKASLIQAKYDELKRGRGSAAEIEKALRLWIRSQVESGDADLDGVSHYNYVDERGVYYPGNSANPRPGGYQFDILHPDTGKVCAKPTNGYRWPKATFDDALAKGDVHWGDDHTSVPKIKKRLETATQLLKSSYYEDNRASTADLTTLMGAKVFDNPKSPRLLMRLFGFTASKDDLIIDFFAGSGTTGEALWRLNAADSGNRRFILVQLPEPLDPENASQVAAAKYCDRIKRPRNIAELCKERLRRASAKLKGELSGQGRDLGFRVFKLDASCLEQWNADTNDVVAALDRHILHLNPARSESDLLVEMLLRRGLDLCVPIENRTIAGKKVQSVGAGSLIACLDTRITRTDGEALALGIAKWHKELNPAGETAVVFRDDAFADDVVKTNVAAILEQHGLKNVRSL